jgi:hypothetical protein
MVLEPDYDLLDTALLCNIEDCKKLEYILNFSNPGQFHHITLRFNDNTVSCIINLTNLLVIGRERNWTSHITHLSERHGHLQGKISSKRKYSS